MKMDKERRRLASVVAVVFATLVAACGSAQSEAGEAASANASGGEQSAGERAASARQTPRPDPGHAWIVFGADTVVAEVARTQEERSEGLMYREELADGTGMLFIFEDTQVRSFWMSNTYVPLDIAYMDASFRIVDIQQMEPLSTEPHESAAPAMFALEVPQGWFEAHGVAVGDTPQVVFGLQVGR